VSDLCGITGRNLFNLLVYGASLTKEDIHLCVRGKPKGKKEELYRPIQGFFFDHNRFILKRLLGDIDMLGEEIHILASLIRDMMKNNTELLDSMAKTFASPPSHPAISWHRSVLIGLSSLLQKLWYNGPGYVPGAMKVPERAPKSCKEALPENDHDRDCVDGG